MADLIGQSLGRYHILEQLGEGGMASVYKAFDTRLEREVAIKVILPQKQHTDTFLRRFEREARTLAKLSHPNIVKVLDYGEQDGQPYLVMEYIPGGMLKKKMGKPMEFREAARLLLPVARALEQAHHENIIHRDVKPSNILLTRSGDPMLSDFGIAKILETEATTIDLTNTGVGIGTPEYMAPEQGFGHAVDARADIYALGIVLYELICGRTPYQADTPMAVMLKKATEPLPSPRRYVPSLPDAVERVLIKALAKDPVNRFENMRGFASALEKLVGEGPTASGESSPEGSWAGSKRFIAVGIAAVVFLLCLAAGGFGIALIANRLSAKPTPFDLAQDMPAPSQRPDPTLTRFESPIPEVTAEIPAAATEEAAGEITEAAVQQLGNGDWIAFNSRMAGDADIYIVQVNGSHLTQLTTSSAHDLYPSWSPDGQQIVYQTNEGGDQELAIIDIATKNVRKLTSNECDDWGPTWSPDGEWIAFYSNCDGEREIYKVLANGSNRQQLTYTSGPYNWFPSWSPDGKRITFSSNRSGSYYIYVMDSDGSNQKELAPGCVSYFSPDGRQILYGVYCNDTDDLMLMNSDGSNQRPITSGYECKNATWSPDGTKIIFEQSPSGIDGQFGIFIMSLARPDKSNWETVTDYDINGRSPVWQP